MRRACDKLFNEHKLARRLLLLWACWLITVVVLRATDLAVIDKITGPAATIVTGVIGILTIVISLYQWSRQREEDRKRESGTN
jgi:hypothetical protein